MKIILMSYMICDIIIMILSSPCLQKTRAHKTRCEEYFKCVELPSKKHVWIPEKCEKGLVYEKNLGVCVLPDDDWECVLEDISNEISNKVKNEEETFKNVKKPETDIHKNRDADMYIVSEENEKSVKNEKDSDIKVIINAINMTNSEKFDSEGESSGDGSEVLEFDGFLPVENREAVNYSIEINADKKESNSKHPKPSENIDPKLTEHLQRLSQLIDSLKQKYQNKNAEEQPELRPDQLNAFLAHFNIKNKYDMTNPTSTDFSDHHKASFPQTIDSTIHQIETPPTNDTSSQEGLDKKLDPEMKVMLTNSFPKQYGKSGYSNSQIVVNRPEGSVMFNLPQYPIEHQFLPHAVDYSHTSPKISEDTLKTVYELSQQMIADQNVPNVIPNTNFYGQPILQPVFLPANIFSGQRPHESHFSTNYNNPNNVKHYIDDNYDNKYVRHRNNYNSHKKGSYSDNAYSKPGTTIIHNNVIPVHISSTNSAEKAILDTYGHNLGIIPNIENTFSNNHKQYQNNINKFITITTVRPVISTTDTNQYVTQYPSSFNTELTATTNRPFKYQSTPEMIVDYYTPSSHLSNDNVNKLFQISDTYSTVQHDNIPQPIDLDRPNSNHQPTAYSQSIHVDPIFPEQIHPSKVKISPNSQKYESMEDDTDEIVYNLNSQYHHHSPQIYDKVYEKKPDVNTILPLSNLYMPRPESSVSSSFKPKYPIYGIANQPNSYSNNNYNENNQLVNIGGNFMSYKLFRNSILPLFGNIPPENDLDNIEVITCAAGVRQPNATDCTRYYVCSKKDGKILSYSCPPYTAFNSQTRICDAYTYSVCNPTALVSAYTVNENKRIQLEAMKALQEAKKKRDQTLKAQNMGNLLLQYDNQLDHIKNPENGYIKSNVPNAYSHQLVPVAPTVTTTAKPIVLTGVKKRKYYCKEGDKIADQTSVYSYFVCYKNSSGVMKGHKMTCSKGLLFCSQTTLCTLPSKCV
ncbi:myb-like protein A [Teleopsis dalmanni]|uniref:myb-like protein A n=1 Tax=Teleopsis dalmanni TaxID=139649 RepID=UPI0018CF66CC|nr:myb-like protein A [Teleopsis dalmanni]